MDPESRPTFSQAVVTLQSIDLSTSDSIIASTMQQAMPEVPFENSERDSVGDCGRTSKDWRRHSSCSDPGDAVQENKGDSGIDPGVFFSEQRKRLSNSCGKLINKLEEFTTFEELEAYLRSYTSCSTIGKESASIEDTVPCSPSEHAKSNQTASPQLVTPSVCKTNKPHLPDPSTPYAPPPTPCTSKIPPGVSLPLLKDTVCDEMLPRAASSELTSPVTMSPCVRRRRTDTKSNEQLSSPSMTTMLQETLPSSSSPDLLTENAPDGYIDNECTPDKPFPYKFYPKKPSASPPPNITIASPID